MSVTVRGQVGPQTLQDGAEQSLRMGKSGEAILTELHGKYYEQVYRGNVFAASVGAAGQAPGTALGTTAAFSLYNPVNSGKNLVIIRGSLGYISGTLGAGSVFWTADTTQRLTAPSGGTALTPVCALIGSGNLSVAKAGNGTTLGGTPVVVRPAFRLDASLATTTALGMQPATDEMDGAIIIAPGYTLALEAIAAAGSIPLVAFGCMWEEVTI